MYAHFDNDAEAKMSARRISVRALNGHFLLSFVAIPERTGVMYGDLGR